MRRYALSAIGRDRPGIVAGLSAVLLEHSLNIEDSQMSILRGYFSVVLILSAGEDLDEGRLRGSLALCAHELSLDAHSLGQIAPSAAEDSAPAQADQGSEQELPGYVVTVYGADHPGIVHAVADALAQIEVNITDLQTRLLAGEGGTDVYAMVLEVSLPEGIGPEQLESTLASVRREQGVEVVVRELDQDAL